MKQLSLILLWGFLLPFYLLGVEDTDTSFLLKNPQMKLAAIDGQAICFKDIREIYQKNLDDLKKNQVTMNPVVHQFMLSNILNQKIEEVLLFKAAKAENLAVPVEKTEAIFNRFREKFPDSETFQNYLKEQEITGEQIKDKILKRLTVQTFQEKLFKDITVSSEEVRTFYEQNTILYQPKAGYQIAHIIIKYPDNSPKIEKGFIKEKMEQIRMKIIEGTSFEEMASLHSQGSTAANGGIIGWVDQDSPIDPPLKEALKNMLPGEISPVIETETSLHLLKLINHRVPVKRTFEEVEAEIHDQLILKKKQNILVTVLKRVQEQTKVEIFEVS